MNILVPKSERIRSDLHTSSGYSLAKRSVHPLQQNYTLQRTVVLIGHVLLLYRYRYALAIRSLSDRTLIHVHIRIINMFMPLN
jgi:hypothetical protein